MYDLNFDRETNEESEIELKEPWMPFAVNVERNKKVLKFGRLLGLNINETVGLWFRICAWVHQNAVDGTLAEIDEDTLADAMGWKVDPEDSLTTSPGFLWEVLQKSQLITENSNGIPIIDGWEEWNGKWVEFCQKQEKKQAENNDLKLDKVGERVKERDGDICHFCQKTVSWKDRRSGAGATYCKLDPNRGFTFENVVVGCRNCKTGVHPNGSTPVENSVRIDDLVSVSAYKTKQNRTEQNLVDSSKLNTNFYLPESADAIPASTPQVAPELLDTIMEIFDEWIDRAWRYHQEHFESKKDLPHKMTKEQFYQQKRSAFESAIEAFPDRDHLDDARDCAKWYAKAEAEERPRLESGRLKKPKYALEDPNPVARFRNWMKPRIFISAEEAKKMRSGKAPAPKKEKMRLDAKTGVLPWDKSIAQVEQELMRLDQFPTIMALKRSKQTWDGTNLVIEAESTEDLTKIEEIERLIWRAVGRSGFYNAEISFTTPEVQVGHQ